MTEESLYSVQCVLMVYNDTSKQWISCGNQPYVSHVYILHNVASDSYRFVGVSEQDREVLLNSDVYRGLKYNQATPVFHQWRDSSRQVYGIKFNNQEDADGFAEVVRTVLDSIQRSQPLSDLSSSGSYAMGTLSRVPLPNDKNFYFSQPMANQQPDSHAQYATPSSHARSVEPQYSQVKHPSTPLAVSQSGPRAAATGMLRQQTHPPYEHNGQAANESNVPDQTKWTPRRSASSGSVLDNVPGLSQRLSQVADASLLRVPSESTVTSMPAASAPPAPPLPAVNTGGLAEALKTATLRKTQQKVVDEQQNSTLGAGTLSRSSVVGTSNNNQGDDVMSEMARKLQERRAKTDQVPSTNNCDSDSTMPPKSSSLNVAEDKAAVPSTPFKAPVPPPVAGKDTSAAKSDRKGSVVTGQSQPSAQLQVTVATTADLENLKRELTNVMRSEIATAKQDILEAMLKMMNR